MAGNKKKRKEHAALNCYFWRGDKSWRRRVLRRYAALRLGDVAHAAFGQQQQPWRREQRKVHRTKTQTSDRGSECFWCCLPARGSPPATSSASLDTPGPAKVISDENMMKQQFISPPRALLSILLPWVFFFFFQVSQPLCWHGRASPGFLITGGSGELIEHCANQDVSYVNCVPPPAGRDWRWGLGVCARCQSWSLSLSLCFSLALSLCNSPEGLFSLWKRHFTHTLSWLPAGRHTDRCAASVRAAPRRSFKAARSSSSRSQKALIWIGCETMLPSRWRQQRKTFLNLNSMFIIFSNLEETYVYYYIFKSVVYCNGYFS